MGPPEKDLPVEVIYERLKRFHTNEIDGRGRVRLREENGGRAGKQKQLGRGIDEYLEEKTPIEIIEERVQKLRTSRMDTRLRTPVPRRKKGGGWERKQLRIELGKDEEARVNLTRNAPDEKS